MAAPMMTASSFDGDGAPTSLTDDERRRIDTFQRVSPSVAYIQTVQQPRALPFSMEVPGGTGSGFVWDGLGHIVTNYHVVATCADTDVPGPPHCTYGLHVPAFCVLEAQGGEPPGPHALYLLGTRTRLGRAVRTAHRGDHPRSRCAAARQSACASRCKARRRASRPRSSAPSPRRTSRCSLGLALGLGLG